MPTRRSFALALASLALAGPALVLRARAQGEARLVIEGGGESLPLPPATIETAEALPDLYNEDWWTVRLQLRSPAKESFAAMTTALVGAELAVLWDGEVIAEPRVMEPITEGEILISGLEELQARRIAALAAYGN